MIPGRLRGGRQPIWSTRSSPITLDSASRLLVNDLSEMRGRAAYLYTNLRINFNEDGGGYFLTDDKGFPLAAPLGPGRFLREYDHDAVFRGVHISSLEIEGGEERSLLVDSNGSFVHFTRIELSFKGQYRTITIDPESGVIQLQVGPLQAATD